MQPKSPEEIMKVIYFAKVAITQIKHGVNFAIMHSQPTAVANLPKLTFDKDEKSPSQRLHATLYVLWEQKGKPTDTFEEFYRISMEKYINHVKEQLV